jgi:hypothetical protein
LEGHPSIFEGEVRKWTNDDESIEQQSRNKGKLSILAYFTIATEDRPE